MFFLDVEDRRILQGPRDGNSQRNGCAAELQSVWWEKVCFKKKVKMGENCGIGNASKKRLDGLRDC